MDKALSGRAKFRPLIAAISKEIHERNVTSFSVGKGIPPYTPRTFSTEMAMSLSYRQCVTFSTSSGA